MHFIHSEGFVQYRVYMAYFRKFAVLKSIAMYTKEFIHYCLRILIQILVAINFYMLKVNRKIDALKVKFLATN